MSKLLLLPCEILALIARAVCREDIENYTLSCRTIFSASLDVLRRHEARKVYSDATVVSFGARSGPLPREPSGYLRRLWVCHPLWVFRALLEDPCAGDYVETLTIADQSNDEVFSRITWLGDQDAFATSSSADGLKTFALICTSLHEQLSTYRDQIEQMVCEINTLLPATISSDWQSRLFRTPTDALLILVLLRAHNLKKLRILNPLNGLDIAVLDNAIRNTKPLRANVIKPFRKLAEVELDFRDRTGNAAALLVRGLCSLPTIRVLKGVHLDSFDAPSGGVRRGYRNQLETLHLGECNSQICDQIRLFGKPRGLKTFHLSTALSSQGWRAFPVGEWLRKYASDQLEELTLYHAGPYQKSNAVTHHLGSLQCFSKLKYARIMITALTTPDESSPTATSPRVPRFCADMLPISLERLILVGKYPRRLIINLIHDVCKRKEACLTNMQCIILEQPPWISAGDYEILEKSAAIGLEIIFGGDDRTA
ncbi:MAG: hypothetical protein Q9210_002773 [Variospora velana]